VRIRRKRSEFGPFTTPMSDQMPSRQPVIVAVDAKAGERKRGR